MAEFFRVNLAVPSSTILRPDDTNKLAFETSAWMRLKRYMLKVENVSAEFKGGSIATTAALTKLQSQVGNFGSPKSLRQLITQNPNALAEETPPTPLYAEIAWLVQHLHESAAFTVITLQGLLELKHSAEGVKETLLLLGHKADNARTPTGALLSSLGKFKDGVLGANNNLSEAYKADAAVLQRQQEKIGALKVRIEGVQKNIDKLGFFSSQKKRTELQQELQSLQQELQDTTTQSEQLRGAIAQLESVLEDGNWLQSSLDTLLEFLDNLRKVWTTFGTGLTQMAADASEAQLEDLTFVKNTLGLEEAIRQWRSIDQAAKQFVVESLVDTPMQ
jgi:hypothetical protein